MNRKLHYGVRLTKSQFDYLKTIPKGKASAFVREAVDEKIRKEKMSVKKEKPSECKDPWSCNECPRYACSYGAEGHRVEANSEQK